MLLFLSNVTKSPSFGVICMDFSGKSGHSKNRVLNKRSERDKTTGYELVHNLYVIFIKRKLNIWHKNWLPIMGTYTGTSPSRLLFGCKNYLNSKN